MVIGLFTKMKWSFFERLITSINKTRTIFAQRMSCDPPPPLPISKMIRPQKCTAKYSPFPRKSHIPSS